MGGKDFVKEHQPDQIIREVPRRQTHAHRPGLGELFGAKANLDAAMIEAYCRYGYRMFEIAKHLKVHYATVSRRLKRAEKGDI
jgi:transcriptional regulator of acetoin/glycerol metabolism